MKYALRITACLMAVVVLGCLLAPPLWWAGQSVGSALGLELLTGQSFQRYFNRSMLVAAVVLLWPLIRWLEITSWRDFGLARNPQAFKDAVIGFVLAIGLLLAMGLVSVGLGVYDVQGTIRWGKFWKIPGTMLAVSLIEEVLFRGVILGLVLRTARPFTGVLFTSALFSIIHFLKPMEVELATISWASGFALLPYSFHQFADPVLVLGGFSTLFAIGVVLALTRLATRSLWMPIGLHAGWIAGNRVFNITFKQQDTLWPWFGPRIEIGLAPLATVILTGLVLAWLLKKQHRLPEHRGVRQPVE